MTTLSSGAERSSFNSAGPTVTLLREESTQHPVALAIAAAWSCYGGRPSRVDRVLELLHGDDSGVAPDKAADRADRRDRALKLYADLFAAGHHTTLQHASFVFVLDNVSRLAIWSFFHSHPFYNSEQVSQRYREVSGAAMVRPDLPSAALAVYDDAITRSLEGYRRLTELLTPEIAARYGGVFPARAKATSEEAQRRFAGAVQKRAQEVARYVLPLATPAHLYHTVNALTLLRYHVLANQPDAPSEVRAIVNQMVREVVAMDPFFLGSAQHPLDLRVLPLTGTLEGAALAEWQETTGTDRYDAERFISEYDASLGPWRNSRLRAITPDAERVMADAIRAVLGAAGSDLDDDAAIARVLDGAQNPYHGHPLYLGMQSKLMQSMQHVEMTFQKRISGAEDAQNQRHRGTPGSRPALLGHLSRTPDVITPWAATLTPEIRREYDATIAAMWDAKNRLLDLGAPAETALYLLPNAHRLRFYESGSLLNYYWKWIKRLCFDAQREISETAGEEVAQVRDALPTIGRYVDGPPCVMRNRAGSRPICPEGERYCGIPVWRNYTFEDLAGRRVL